MKKPFILSIIRPIIPLLSFFKYDGLGKSSNKMNKTKWITSYSNSYIVLEFSENIVTGYFADSDLVLDGCSYVSNYSIIDNLILNDDFFQHKYSDATIEGSFLNVSCEWKRLSGANWSSMSVGKFQKQ